MPFSCYLTGDIQSVSSTFSQIVSRIQTAANWSLSWSGTGEESRDALIIASECANDADTERAVRAIAELSGVVFRPGRI